ncbi:RNA 2',3'-cyclic phosphodiesterase [Variovorax sp. KBW07]|uniref:2'-5' RNA ligase family protein n=1 Tax=Variovorax sp. KBW07 TaxID=2153358 RepID=UPI000F585D75|nr:2'-5' RNA ligase family protein [Variovorax sp. KBW07]RQO42109.1 RNA 2',3'-cyclic phosphodiesterase [Variovorax sp. KBW07]
MEHAQPLQADKARSQLLIGLFPDEPVRAEIKAHCDDWWWPRGCHFPPANRWHLTLQYLDDQDEFAERRLRAALARVSLPALELTLDHSCTWRNDISVVQPADHQGLRALQAHVEHAVHRAGFVPLVRGWNPHVTIARDAEHAACPPLKPIRWNVREFRLVRSHFTQPFRHELLASYPAHPKSGAIFPAC